MGFYYGIRGWLEVPNECYGAVMQHLDRHQEQAQEPIKSYLAGWHACGKSDSGFFFYGADVRKEGLDVFNLSLRTILDLDIWDPDPWGKDLSADGYFKIDADDETKCYSITIIDNEIFLKDEPHSRSIPILTKNKTTVKQAKRKNKST